MLTVSRSGLLYTERFTIQEGTYTLTIPIKETQIPNLHVQVDLVGSAPRIDNNGEAVEKAALLDHYKARSPFLFDGVDSSGGGAPGGNGGAGSSGECK